MRYVRWYQVNTSDIRSIGVAQAAATFFAAIGTFALSTYIDFSKDISAAESSGAKPAQFLKDVVNLAYWGWIFFWFLALMVLLWQGSELRRIKSEHREVTFIGALWRLLKSKILGSNSG